MPLSLTSHPIIPTQALTNNFGVGNRQLVNIGGILYYITKREITLLSGDAFLLVYASDNTGLTWSLVASLGGGGGPGTLSEFSIAVVGTKIYILDRKNTNPNWFLGIWTFDSVAVTLTGPAANNGPQTNNDTAPVGLSALNSGALIAVYTKGGGGASFNAAKYTPGTDTWGAPVALNAATNSQVVAQISDPVTDRTVVFYNKGGTNTVIATILDNTVAILNTTGTIYDFLFFFPFNAAWGSPTITSDSASGGSSAVLPFLASGNVKIGYVDLTSFAVTTEIVDDGTDLPGGTQIQAYSQQDQQGWAALDFGGTLYVVFTVDNGNLNSALSQCWLYAKARTGGVWTGLQILFTSAVSREMLAPFATSWNVNGPAILVNLWDPTFDITGGPSAAGLTSFILLPLAVPPLPSIGNNRYGVNTFLPPQPANSIPYRLCVNNNRLYCVLPDFNGIFSCFVYYLGRENNQGGYWYRYVIDPAALFSEEDGILYGGFGDAGVGNLFTLDQANVLNFAGTQIPIDVIFPFSKNEINQRKDVYHLRLHLDTGGSALNLTGYTEFGPATAFSLGTVTTSGITEVNLLIQNTNFNLAKRLALRLCGLANYFKLVDWSIDYDVRPEPLSFLRIATNYSIAAKKRIRTIPIVIDTRGNAVNINVTVDGVAYGNQVFTTNERTTVFYYFNTDVFATDLIINVLAANGNTFEFYDTPPPVNVETLPVGKLFDQIGPVELERIGALLEFRVRMMATTNTLTYNVFMDDVSVVTGQTLTVTPNVDKTYGPIKMPKGVQGSVCRVEFLSSGGVFYRWNCKLKFTTGGTKSDTKQITIQDPQVGRQS